jgi:ubiquinone/menaquinone biosynthesis C-methylase UbiE
MISAEGLDSLLDVFPDTTQYPDYGVIMSIPSIICPSCRRKATFVPNQGWSCPNCPHAIRMIDEIPVFAVRACQIAEITASILASHEYNLNAAAVDHLAYTDHTIAIHRELMRIIESAFSAERRSSLNVLDVGGGRGELAILLARNFDTTMIDVDLFSARAARAIQRHDSRLQVLCGDCSSLPIESGSVDVVITKETAHHMADPDSFFAELARVVRHDGLVLVVEGIQSAIVNRKKSLARDRMRQLGATHHHFLLWDVTRPLKRMFADTHIAYAAPALFTRSFAKIGLPGMGQAADRFLTDLPMMLRYVPLLAGGGSIVLASRQPIVGEPLQFTDNPQAQQVVDYPANLADVEMMPESLINSIRDRLCHSL